MPTNDMIALLTAVLPFLVPAGMALYKRLLESMPSSRRSVVQSVVQTVVSGVEQSKNGQPGADKKAAAVTAVSSILHDLGLKVSPTMVDMLIEAAVYSLNAAQPATSPMAMSVSDAPIPAV